MPAAERVGIVDGHDRHIDAFSFQRGAQFLGHVESLQLTEIRRFQNDAAADHTGEAGAHALDGTFLSELADLAA